MSASLLSTAVVEDLQFSCSKLRATDGTEFSGEADLFVVKRWQQSGISVYQHAPITVPELLVKDDRQDMTDRYIRSFRHVKHLIRPYYLYEPPDVRLEGPVITNLEANQPKQVWLRIRIAEHCKPGTYSGVINFANGADSVSGALPFSIRVLPIKLEDPDQTLLLWFKGSLDWRNRQHYLSETMFSKQLADIYQHGFRSISFLEPNPKLAQRAVDIAEEIGFDQLVLFSPPYPWAPNGVVTRKMKIAFYLSDELDGHIDLRAPEAHPLMIGHKERWNQIGNTNTKIASVLSEKFYQRMLDPNDIGAAPDIPSLYLPSNRAYYAMTANGSSEAKRTYYYWMSHMEKPNVHRVLAGVYLWKSKAAGIMPYCYQHLPVAPFSPYNDFDPWEPAFQVGNIKRTFRHHMTTYPSKTQPIPTIQREAMRQGINDLLYLTTLDKRLAASALSADKEVRQTGEQISKAVTELTKPISLLDVQITSDNKAEPYSELSPEFYEQIRAKIAENILTLDSGLNAPL